MWLNQDGVDMVCCDTLLCLAARLDQTASAQVGAQSQVTFS